MLTQATQIERRPKKESRPRSRKKKLLIDTEIAHFDLQYQPTADKCETFCNLTTADFHIESSRYRTSNYVQTTNITGKSENKERVRRPETRRYYEPWNVNEDEHSHKDDGNNGRGIESAPNVRACWDKTIQ